MTNLLQLHTPAPTPNDPFRSIIWGIGNGSSEHQLCTTLEDAFHIVCPLANLVDVEICVDFKSAYKARCKDPHLAAEGTFLYLALVLILCLSLASVIKTKKLVFIPDSAITIGVGWVTGLLVLASRQGEGRRFDEQVFFDMLLPFILFEAGYSMDRTLLRRKLSLISTLATFGTLVSFFATLGLMVAAVRMLNTEMSLLDCAIFAALISSTDPVAVVAVFASMGVNADLFIVIFGESTFNDCVSVALYGSFKYFYSHPKVKDGEALGTIFSTFAYVAFGSLALGFICGIGTAYLWKRVAKRWFTHPVLETLLFLLFALLPYYIADALHWSGVVAIISTSITLSIYAHPNLSKTASFHVVFLVECLSRLFEACIFGYLGTQMVVNNEKLVWSPIVPLGAMAVIVARFLATMPLITIHNVLFTTSKREMVPFKHQVVVWFSGLRGALAFALAVTIPEYDSVTQQGSHYAGEILATTCFIIVWMVFIMAPLTPLVIRWAGVLDNGGGGGVAQDAISSPASNNEDGAASSSKSYCGHFMDIIHERYLRPILVATFRDDPSFMANATRQEIQTSPGSAIFVRDLEEEEDGEYAVVHLNTFMDESASENAPTFPRSTVALLRSVSDVMSPPPSHHTHHHHHHQGATSTTTTTTTNGGGLTEALLEREMM